MYTQAELGLVWENNVIQTKISNDTILMSDSDYNTFVITSSNHIFRAESLLGD